MVQDSLASCTVCGAYEATVELKENARNDIDLANAERDQAITQADTMLLEAQAEANRTLNSASTSVSIIRKKAESQALAITRQYAAWQSMYGTVKSSQGARRAPRRRRRRALRCTLPL